MSVVGFDFGTKNCVIAVAQRGGIDVIINEVSNRLTPSMVSFGEKERFIGEPALTNWMRNIRGTYTDLKRFVGHKFDEEYTQNELKREAFKGRVLPEQGGKIGFDVTCNGEPATFTPESLVGMVLGKLKRTTEAATSTKCRDVVISVPGYWTDFQRRALLDAAHIAGLNVLRLMNELTATALSYGIYKQLPDDKPMKVMIIDMGDSSTSVGVFAYKKGEVKVLATTYDPTLGGRNFDDLLVTHFAKEFKEKFKVNVYENQRALLRLQVACEKLKKMLSSNPEAPLNIDSLMNDVDVRGMMDRKTFEELSKPLLERLVGPIKQAIEESGSTFEELASIEITGGGTRATSVQKKIQETVGREIGKTINAEEAVARGCALQCAMLSPVFKVREFAIHDISPYPIKISWKYNHGVSGNSNGMDVDSTAKDDSAEIFTKNNPIPSPKLITFNRADSVELVAHYLPHPLLSPDTPTLIGKWRVVNTVGKSPNAETGKMKVKVKLDIHGVFSIENSQLVETFPEETPTASPASTPTTTTTTGTADATETKMDAEPTNAAPAPEGEKKEEKKEDKKEEKKEEEKKKTKVRRTELKVEGEPLLAYPEKQLQDLTDEEAKMLEADVLAFETADRKNAVESYVYNMRGKISSGGELYEFISDHDRTVLLKLLDDTENWLYGEGEDQTKSVYQKKLDDMQKIGEPAVHRRRESDERPISIQQLTEVLNHYRAEATTVDEKYDHILKEDKDKVLVEIEAIQNWLAEHQVKQQTTPKSSNPIFSIKEITDKKNALERSAKAVFSKPKPKPQPAPQPTPATPDTAQSQQQQSAPSTPQQPTSETTTEPSPSKANNEAGNENSSTKTDPTNPSVMDLD